VKASPCISQRRTGGHQTWTWWQCRFAQIEQDLAFGPSVGGLCSDPRQVAGGVDIFYTADAIRSHSIYALI